ncbi:MAG: antibiotic biosynthesis monooxygenase [Thermoproteota archaeon]|nr:antibiotic biosynthesis monooxygenase [Thermoproteota archaeon]
MGHNNIHFRAEFTVEEGKIEDFKKLIQEIARTVQETEPGTITYQFYLNNDNTKCIVHETYENSDAAINHMNGIASKTILPKIFEVAKINRFDTYGIPSEELQKILLAGFGSEMYNLFTGFSR